MNMTHINDECLTQWFDVYTYRKKLKREQNNKLNIPVVFERVEGCLINLYKYMEISYPQKTDRYDQYKKVSKQCVFWTCRNYTYNQNCLLLCIPADVLEGIFDDFLGRSQRRAVRKLLLEQYRYMKSCSMRYAIQPVLLPVPPTKPDNREVIQTSRIANEIISTYYERTVKAQHPNDISDIQSDAKNIAELVNKDFILPAEANENLKMVINRIDGILHTYIQKTHAEKSEKDMEDYVDSRDFIDQSNMGYDVY